MCTVDLEIRYINNSFDIISSSNGLRVDNISLFADEGTTTEFEILNAYYKYGFDCLSHLKGTFAFCLFDSTAQTLLVARDCLGVKQLYFYQTINGFIFSTELRNVLAKVVKPVINPVQFASSIRYNYPIDLRRTWISQINRIKAGEFATVDHNGIYFKSYWTRNHTQSFDGSKDAATAQALRLVRESLKRSLNSVKGPVAILLSGGIDSTSLAALTQEINPDVHVISAGYKGNVYTACDEREIAKRFSKERGFHYHEVELDNNDFVSIIDVISREIDESCFDISSIAQYALYRKASEMGYKAIVSGLGGDELFFSYQYHHKLVRALQLRKEFHSLIPVKKNFPRYLTFLLNNYRFLLSPTFPVALDESILVPWTYKDYSSFAKDAYLDVRYSSFRFSDFDVHVTFPETLDVIQMYDFMMSTFASSMCVFLGNKLAHANKIEIVYPFLDTSLVEFMDSLPLQMKFNTNKPKQFQKDMMKNILPEYILNARKRGFEPPFEFIKRICSNYSYDNIRASHCFYNSMMADKMISNFIIK